MITATADNKPVNVELINFSDGAFSYRISGIDPKPKTLWLTVSTKTPVSQVREHLELFIDALINFNLGGTKVILSLDYMPYARADRRFEKGMPFPLLNFLCWLREFDFFDEIHTKDIHNETLISEMPDLEVINKPQLSCFIESLPFDFDTNYDIVLAPDSGSTLKAKTIASHLEVDVFHCQKIRDVTTGKITKSELPFLDFEGKTILIPDDILDGGYTFRVLAKMLKERGAKKVDLYVTHLIASKGLDIFKGIVDTLYVNQVIGSYVNKQNVTEFNSKI